MTLKINSIFKNITTDPLDLIDFLLALLWEACMAVIWRNITAILTQSRFKFEEENTKDDKYGKRKMQSVIVVAWKLCF